MTGEAHGAGPVTTIPPISAMRTPLCPEETERTIFSLKAIYPDRQQQQVGKGSGNDREWLGCARGGGGSIRPSLAPFLSLHWAPPGTRPLLLPPPLRQCSVRVCTSQVSSHHQTIPTPSQVVMVPLQGSLSPGTPCIHQVVIQSGAKKAWMGGGGRGGGLLLAQKA